ncbi:MAG: class I SAM-dependent methyltransferase [Holophagaceae bacterium]|nr:class I SAM-dependent methyltransferase [Holophagaceae bacterium]
MIIFPEKIRGIAQAYLSLLDRWNKIHSFTSLNPDTRFESLLLDSSVLLPHLISLSPDSRVADFGSGIGIPAVVIAAYRPDIRVFAIDRNHKKMAFVQQVALELNLQNLFAVRGSIDSLAPLNAHFGTAKAVGAISLLLKWWKRHSAPSAPFFAFRGPDCKLSGITAEWCYEIFPYELPVSGQRSLVRFCLGAKANTE